MEPFARPDRAPPASSTGQLPVDPQVAFLTELIEEHATVAGDVIEVGPQTWAIHGSIGLDGEVLLAEYGTEAEARLALARLPLLDLGPDPRP